MIIFMLIQQKLNKNALCFLKNNIFSFFSAYEVKLEQAECRGELQDIFKEVARREKSLKGKP